MAIGTKHHNGSRQGFKDIVYGMKIYMLQSHACVVFIQSYMKILEYTIHMGFYTVLNLLLTYSKCNNNTKNTIKISSCQNLFSNKCAFNRHMNVLGYHISKGERAICTIGVGLQQRMPSHSTFWALLSSLQWVCLLAWPSKKCLCNWDDK